MSLLEYSQDIVIKNPCKEVQNCTVCKYFTNSSFLMRNHVMRHQLPRKTFNCEESAPEAFYCKDCDFKTGLTILFKKHIQEIHLIKIENEDESQNVEYTLQSFICKNCTFETCSSLQWLQHLNTGCLSNEKTHLEADSQEILNYTRKKEDLGAHVTQGENSFESSCDESSLGKHKINHSLAPKEVKWYQCIHCPYKAIQKQTVLRHENNKHKPDNEINWFKCDHCDYKAKMKDNLKVHLYVKHEKDENIKWHQCDSCSYKGKRKQHLKAHILNKHTELKDLHFKAIKKSNLMIHMLKHLTSEENLWLQCDKCPFKAKYERTLKSHKTRTHRKEQNLASNEDGDNSFECYHCGYKAHLKYNLITHIFRKHTPSENWLHCDKCSFKTISASGLKKHIKNHCLPPKEIKWYNCIHCPYKTKDTLNLSLHELNTHRPHDINWLKCDHCDYKTKKNQLLKAHQYRRHEKDEHIKWHKCNSCSYKCKEKRSLRTHTFIKHTELKDADFFHCDKCDFKAKLKGSLKRHNVLMHSTSEEIQWFQCDQCAYKAKTPYSLVSHKTYRHGEKQNQYDSCSYKT